MSDLHLGSNQISDISPLGGLESLMSLFINDNQISDISPLGELTHLHGLLLNGNQISDISPLRGLMKLSNLNLENNKISQEQIEELKTALPKWDGRCYDYREHPSVKIMFDA